MLPGPNIVRECPKCTKPFSQMTMSSGNTFGAKLWSDRKLDAPMMIENTKCGVCPECGSFIWIERSLEIGRVAWNAIKESKYPNARLYKNPRIVDYVEALNDLTLNTKDEICIRNLLMHCSNDQFRNGLPKLTVPAEDQKNQLRLIELLGDSEDDRLLKAEIHRELGNFDSALAILEGVFDQSRQWVAEKLITLCLAKNTDVVVLDHS